MMLLVQWHAATFHDVLAVPAQPLWHAQAFACLSLITFRAGCLRVPFTAPVKLFLRGTQKLGRDAGCVFGGL